MWTCPKCGRTFARQNQGHYCGKAPATVAEYIAAQSPAQQPRLEELATLIRSLAPDCSERIKWSMPSFENRGSSLQFAACKDWISLYVGADLIAQFQDRLEGLRYKKDALYLPYEGPLPWEALGELLLLCLTEQ